MGTDRISGVIWISAASVDISPLENVYLGCGTGSKVGPGKITDPLEANILLVHSLDKKSKVVIISVDTLFLGPRVSSEIISGVSGVFENKEIFLAATHTHTAPMVDETKPILGIRNDDYSDFLVSRIVRATLDLVSEEPTLVTINSWATNLGGIVSRRRLRLFDLSRNGIRVAPVLQRPNFNSHKRDFEANICEFVTDSGVVMARIGVIPCHAVAYQGQDVISGDLVSSLRNELNSRQPGEIRTPFVFLQGASGDLNPWWRARWLNGGLVGLLDQLINGPRFPTLSRKQLANWGSQRVNEIFTTRNQRPLKANTADTGQVDASIQEFPLSSVLKSAHGIDSRNFIIQELAIESLHLVGVSAEVTWAYQQEMSGFFCDRVVVGCLRDTFGYVASSEQYSQGGYEAQEHQTSFSISHFESRSPGRQIGKLFFSGPISNGEHGRI